MWERRLYKLRDGQEDEWRELWVWGYAFVVVIWLLAAPHFPAKKFPWSPEIRSLEFLNRQSARKFDHFTGARQQPSLPAEPFQHKYSSSRPHLYRKVLRSAILRSHRAVLGSGALAVTLSWWLRSAYYVHYNNEYAFLLPETVRLNFAAGAKVHQVLLPLSSFVLSMYLVFNVARLFRIMDLAWKVQGRIYDLAILLGTLLMPHHADPRVQKALFKIYGHLNLAHVLAYEEVSESVSKASKDPSKLKVCGLLDEQEGEELAQAQNRVTVVTVWLSNLTNRLIESGIVPQVFAPAILEALTELLDVVSSFHAEALRTPPMAVSHMMQLFADLMCLLTPAMLAHIFHQDDSSSPTYLWPWAGSMIVALFYQGMMSLAQSLETPFDDAIDGLNADWALATTERQIFGCLSGAESGGPAMAVESLNLLRPRTTPVPPAVASTSVPTAITSASAAVASALAPYSGRQQMSVEEPIPATGDMTVSADSTLPDTSSGSVPQPFMTRDSGRAKKTGDMTRSADNSESVPVIPRLGPRACPGGCGFQITWHSTHCCGRCSDGDGHGEKCDQKDMPNLPPRMGNEKVPLEAVPSEAPWVPRETNETAEHSAKGQWGTLNQELLQATRAALLVPREITLDAVSLERLETVTARPLSEIAAALLRSQPVNAPMPRELLALTQAPHVHVDTNANPLTAAQLGSDVVKDLLSQYHYDLNQNSDMRAQIAAVQGGLAAPKSLAWQRAQTRNQALGSPDSPRGADGPGAGSSTDPGAGSSTDPAWTSTMEAI